MSDFSPSGKRTLRSAVLAARRALPAPERQRADEAIAAALAPLATGRVVAGYVPMPGEPGGSVLLAALASASRLLLPVLRDDLDLDWAEFAGDLVPVARGLREPPGPRLGVAAVTAAALVVVPAVAVDRRGMRLGRGGGSYDRSLARVTSGSGRLLAVTYDTELVDLVPSEPHDRPVDGVITPSGLWSPGTAP